VSDKGAAHAGPEDSLENRVASLLRVGVLVSVAVIVLGAALLFARHWRETPDYRAFCGEPRNLRLPVGILQGALQLRGRAVVDLGLLLLILTPVARVALSAVAFVRARDWLYTVVTALVFAILLYSLLGGLAWPMPAP
jgi:uncharacterized membrane protein